MSQTVVLAIVPNAGELSLACTIGLLRLQQLAARRDDVRLNVHIVGSFLEALNTYVDGDIVVVLDGSVGAPPELIFGAIASPHDVVAGVYPLAKVDWDRVGAVLRDPRTKEPLSHAGNVYNLVPASGPVGRYVAVESVQELKALCIRSSVLRDLAGPDTSHAGGHLFAYDAVFDDTLHNVYQTLARRIGLRNIVADLEAQCTHAGPAQFAGCVGLRGSVR